MVTNSTTSILAAIAHFVKKDYECAITLAAAGEGQVKEKTSNHLFRLIRAKFSADEDDTSRVRDGFRGNVRSRIHRFSVPNVSAHRRTDRTDVHCCEDGDEQ
jgi:hypothetical protein